MLQSVKIDYSDPAQVKKAFNQAMLKTIEKNITLTKKKEPKMKKKVNIIEYDSGSPMSKFGPKQIDMSSAVRSPQKKSVKNTYNTPKR